MLEILNRTRLTAGTALFIDPWGRELACVVAKGTFEIPTPGHAPRVAEEQVEPLPANVHHGEPAVSSIKYPADVAPGKAGTDVLLVGSARSPWSRPVQYLDTSVRVGPLAKRVLVMGDRTWDGGPAAAGFRTTDPLPFVEMPLVYERAFGGRDPLAAEGAGAWDPRNPVGLGFRVKADAVPGAPVANLEDRDHLIGSWRDRPPVVGFGAVDGHWEPRRALAGTYDDAWQATQAPLLPTDFDIRFCNVAPAGLAADGFLQGGEPVELVNVGGDGHIAFTLPTVDVRLAIRLGDPIYGQRPSLWTVLFEPDRGQFTMTWGASFLTGKQPSRAHGVEITVDGPMRRELTLDGVG
jgi:hypothetical protein